MNDKEKELWRVIDNVIKCCAITAERRVEHYERRRSRQVSSRKPRNDTMYGR